MKPDRRMYDLMEDIAERARERLRFISQNREQIIEAFIAETGAPPSECVLIEQPGPDGSLHVRIERGGEVARLRDRVAELERINAEQWSALGAARRLAIDEVIGVVEGMRTMFLERQAKHRAERNDALVNLVGGQTFAAGLILDRLRAMRGSTT